MAAKALIVVDMQNGFLREGALASDRCLAVLPAVIAEVEAALERGEHVIFTADTHEVGDREFEIFPVHCLRGTAEADLVGELEPYLVHERVHKVVKRRYSAMFETELEGLLHRHGIGRIRICGVCTDICVLHTTADLRNRDIAVTVAATATATFDAPGHPGDEAQASSLAHLRGILGATVEA
ncbi:MAG: cysteine hydrolase family protein [Egibacteraceae bacterium]